MADLVTQTWLEDPKSVRVILVQVDFSPIKYLATRGMTVSSQTYEPAITNNFTVSSSIGIDYSSSISASDIEILNANGVRDSWLTEKWINKPIRVYFGDASWPTITNFKQIFTGVVGNLDARNRDTLNITIRDSLQRLNYPIAETLLGNYNPTNVGGYANPNEKQTRPLCFGEVFNVTPLQTSPITLEYMCNNGAVESIVEVRDNGVPVAFNTLVDSALYAFSSSSILLGTGSKTFASPETSLVSVGMTVRIYRTSDSTIYFDGVISSIVTNTSITVTVSATGGAAGTYVGWFFKLPIPTGSFRLVNKPIGTITATVQGTTNSTIVATNTPSTTYTNNVVNIIATIIRLYSKGPAVIDTVSFAAMETVATTTTVASLGFYAVDRFNVFTVCEELAASIGMALYTNLDGTIGIAQVSIPTSGAIAAITNTDILLNSLEISSVPDVLAGVRLGYAKNWTVQVGIVTDIPEEHKLEFAKEWNETQDFNSTAITDYGLSPEASLEETYLVNKANADAVRATKLAFRSVRRVIYKITTTSKHLLVTAGSAVTIASDRFGFTSTPTYARVLTSSPDWIRGTIELEVLL